MISRTDDESFEIDADDDDDDLGCSVFILYLSLRFYILFLVLFVVASIFLCDKITYIVINSTKILFDPTGRRRSFCAVGDELMLAWRDSIRAKPFFERFTHDTVLTYYGELLHTSF